MTVEQGIDVFLLGSAAGSIVTYWYVTREARLIRRIRKDMSLLGMFHDLTPGQYRLTMDAESTESLISDKQILVVYRKSLMMTTKTLGPVKIHPERLAAEIIICEDLLGLSVVDATRALQNAKTLDELAGLLPKNSS